MNAYRWTYQGQPVEVQSTYNAYLVEIGHLMVRVKKPDKVKKKWPKLRIVK